MNSPRNTPSKLHQRPARSTPISLRKQTPGQISRRQFAYRRQNRLLRSELATILGRCSQMERTIAELNAQLTEERDQTLQVVPVDKTVLELRNSLTAERAKLAVNTKTEILRSKLREAFKENRLLKVKIDKLEKVRSDLVHRHKTSLTNIKSTADELVCLIEKERTLNYADIVVKKFESRF
ncbi:hypothetical protein quinque_011054 [Culex quinquefasciatus]